MKRKINNYNLNCMYLRDLEHELFLFYCFSRIDYNVDNAHDQ